MPLAMPLYFTWRREGHCHPLPQCSLPVLPICDHAGLLKLLWRRNSLASSSHVHMTVSLLAKHCCPVSSTALAAYLLQRLPLHTTHTSIFMLSIDIRMTLWRSTCRLLLLYRTMPARPSPSSTRTSHSPLPASTCHNASLHRLSHYRTCARNGAVGTWWRRRGRAGSTVWRKRSISCRARRWLYSAICVAVARRRQTSGVSTAST